MKPLDPRLGRALVRPITRGWPARWPGQPPWWRMSIVRCFWSPRPLGERWLYWSDLLAPERMCVLYIGRLAVILGW